MDAIHMQQAGLNAMFNFGVNYTFSNKKISQLLRAGIDTIVLAFDNDKAGLEGMARYLSSDLGDFFHLELGRNFEPLKEFYESGAKDFAEFVEGREG
jgi:DNA primase